MLQYSHFRECIDDSFPSCGSSVAIRSRGKAVLYSELYKDIVLIAGGIHSLLGGCFSPVAVLLPGSPEYITTILSVLYAGKTFLPLDPRHSSERNAGIITQTQCSLIITDESSKPAYDELPGKVVTFQELRSYSSSLNYSAGLPEINPETIAYILFTSGSTGTPKGVTISHGNILHFAQIVTERFSLTHNDRFLFSASVAYAVSVRQIFIPLLLGAVIVVAGPEEIADPLLLFALAERERVTFMDMVPSYMRKSADCLGSASENGNKFSPVQSLRCLISVGEPLYKNVAEAMYKYLPPKAVIVNILGQTETTGMIAAYTVPRIVNSDQFVLPCGYPVAGIEIFVVDENLCVLPGGGEGELCVASKTVSPGYYNNEEANQRKFFALQRNGKQYRVYRTGDKGRINNKGMIELTGRTDFQFKIAGNRIEAAEVEFALFNAGIKEAVVYPVTDAENRQILCAVIAGDKRLLNAEEIKSSLIKQLPAFMVPEKMFRVSSFPLNTNGKTDRNLLKQITADYLLKQRKNYSGKAEPLLCYAPEYTATEKLRHSEHTITSHKYIVVWDESNAEANDLLSAFPGAGCTLVKIRNAEELHSAIAQLRESGFAPVQNEPVSILYIPSNSADNHEAVISASYANLRNLVRLLNKLQQRTENDLHISLTVLNLSQGNNGNLPPGQAGSALYGLLKAAVLEITNLKVKYIKAEIPDNKTISDLYISSLLKDCTNNGNEDYVLYKNSNRFIKNFKQVNTIASPVNLKQGGTYLITGGTGYLGLVTAKTILEYTDCTVILNSRAGINEKLFGEIFGKALRNSNADKSLFETATGKGKILLYTDDIALPGAAERTYEYLASNGFHLNGIIHSAGVRNRFSLLDDVNEQGIYEEMKAKAEGSLYVLKLAQLCSAEFVIMYSSISSVLGRYEQSVYCAANAFIDNLSDYRGCNISVVNWDSWEEPASSGLRRDKLFAAPIQSDEVKEIILSLFGGVTGQLLITRRQLAIVNTGRDIDFTELQIKRSSYAAPETTLEADLILLWEDCLGIEGIGIADNFFLLGGNSLTAMKIFSRINQKYGKSFPLEGIADAPTVRMQARAMKNYTVTSASSPLTLIKKGDAATPPLFCISSGLTSFHFYSLAAYLPGSQPVYGVQALPGMELLTVEDRVDKYIKAIKEIAPTGPYYLCGESFGGVLAYQAAVSLRNTGDEIALLGLFDSNADQLKHIFSSQTGMTSLLKQSERYLFRFFRRMNDRLSTRSVSGRSSFVKNTEPDIINITGKDADAGFSNDRQKRTYIPPEYPGDAVLFKAANQSIRSVDNKYYGWKSLIRGEILVIPVPGDHTGIFRHPFVKVLAAELSAVISSLSETRKKHTA